MNFLNQATQQFFYTPIQRFTHSNNWKIKATLLLVIASFIFSTGPFFYLPTAFKNENWNSFNFKKENLFKQPPYRDVSHAAKKTFRITVPLIAKVFHFNNWATVAFIWLLNILFLFFLLEFLVQLLNDKTIAFLGTFGFTFIYAGHAGFTDIASWFDEAAYFFLLMALFSKQKWVIYCSIILACFTDERAFASSVLVAVFHYFSSENKSLLQHLKQISKCSISIIALCTAIFIRILLQQIFNLHTSSAGASISNILNDSDFWGMGIWTFLEGYWLLVGTLFLFLMYSKQYLKSVALISIIGLFIMGAFMVFDETRSGSYMFPILFIAIAILQNELTTVEWRMLFLIIAIICFIFPAYYIISDTSPYTLWYKPIFVRVLDFINLKLH
ncbi:MAG: hypothetical protein RIQ33_352 [Bacteroidota bacterium]|jgi:hypothetical protein